MDVYSNIDRIATAECIQDAVPLLCLYQFPIYSCRDQQMLLPSKEECQRISTMTCQAEIKLAFFFGIDVQLPDCNQLPSIDNDTGKHESLVS